VEEYCKAGRVTDYNMAHAHCVLELMLHTHSHTHSQYAINIAFPLQQWLYEIASVSRYTCIDCLVLNSTVSTSGHTASEIGCLER